MSDVDESSSNDSKPIVPSRKKSLPNQNPGKTNENSESKNKELIQNIRNGGKDESEKNITKHESEGNLFNDLLKGESNERHVEKVDVNQIVDSLDDKKESNQIGKARHEVSFERIENYEQMNNSHTELEETMAENNAQNSESMLKVDLENMKKELLSKQEKLESIQKENDNIKTSLMELEKSKEKTENEIEIVKKSHQDSLNKIVNLEGRLAKLNAINVTLLSADLENKKKESKSKQEFELIQKENYDIKIKLFELEKSKEKTRDEIEIVKKSHQDSLNKIVNLEGKLAKMNVQNVELVQNVNNIIQNKEEELQLEQVKSKSILDDLLQKYENVKEKNQIDNINHIKMYQMYERKIEQMNAENKQIKNETIRLNRMLQTKEEIVIQSIEKIKQLENQLIINGEENYKISQELVEKSNNLERFKLEYNNKEKEFESSIQQLSNELEQNRKSKNLEEKEYHDNLICINNEMKDKIDKYLSNIYSVINENDLSTSVSNDLLNEIIDLNLSITNILESFCTNLKIIDENFKNDFNSNFNKILIIKKNLELLEKINSIDVGSCDEIDGNSNMTEIQNFIDSIELLNKNLREKIIETLNDLKLTEENHVVLIEEIFDENMNKFSTNAKENLNLIKNLFNEKNLLKEKFAELKRFIIENLNQNNVD